MEEITRDVFLVRASDVNCYLLRDGEDVTLVDAGYPADTVTVMDALENIGRRPQDVKAILVTHAHIDHIGAVGQLHDTYGTPVYTGEAEVAHAHGDYREQLTPVRAVLNAWRPGALPWMVRAARHGGTRRIALPYAQTFDPDEGALDLPGKPLPVTTRGHTTGHTAYLLPGPGAVLTGDALVTGHPLSRHEGPQLLPKMFHHDEDQARGPALGELDKLDAELLLPGHGDAWNVPMSKAVDAARGER
ncbi:MBL fold metallo-hydrolase [Streptomyces sp. ODS28]|uniref:MBL fold metallo-hydrolase n=1 Tax=Streptomyces sp. ODS28 TaxID=3136688 RepID=UPI0031EF1880